MIRKFPLENKKEIDKVFCLDQRIYRLDAEYRKILEKLGFQFKENVQNLEETLKEYVGMLYFYIAKKLFLKRMGLK